MEIYFIQKLDYIKIEFFFKYIKIRIGLSNPISRND